MYSLVRTIHPPTAVEHSCYCNLISPSEKSLVVAATSRLHVLKVVKETQSDGETNSGSAEPAKAKTRLECQFSTSLFGNIVSMKSVKLHWQMRDVLLLAFRDAKMSVVEYDPLTHDLKTLSLHFFEEEMYKDGFYRKFMDPIVRVDPDRRCAVMLFYGAHLAVFPFKRENNTEDGSSGAGKTPVSSSYIISCAKMDQPLRNIKDVEFLNGYYEPTLALIYEPLKTWSGRVPIRSDTFAFAAISLNLHERVHPVIWRKDKLPYDCFRVVGVPLPVGGALLLAATSLIYLSQSTPPLAVSLNSVTETMTAFPMKPQPGVSMVLDGCVHGFLSSNQLVLQLKTGDIYILSLLVDRLNSMQGFTFDKTASSVLSSCLTVCDNGCIFLGSRLGNSLLLRYTEKGTTGTELMGDLSAEEGPPGKKRKPDSDWMAVEGGAAGVGNLGEDLDELEVYGTDTQEGAQVKMYTFEVCDSVLNIGPCGQMTVGEPAFLSEELGTNSEEPDLEVVVTSGYGKNGALSVLQRSIRPVVVTSFELPGCTDMWTVVGNPDHKPKKSSRSGSPTDKEGKDTSKGDTEGQGQTDEGEKPKDEAVPETVIEGSHDYLLLSKKSSTMILQTGSDITELGPSGFATEEPTVLAGNIGNNKYIFQVTPFAGVKLIEGVNLVQSFALKDCGSPIVHCSAADPYILLVAENGHTLTLLLDGETNRLRPLSDVQLPQSPPIAAVCLYKDVGGALSTEQPSAFQPINESASALLAPAPVIMATTAPENVEDEDDLLYGDDPGTPEDQTQSTTTQGETTSTSHPGSLMEGSRKPKLVAYYAFVVRNNGALEIFSLPSYSLVFRAGGFAAAEKTLTDQTDNVGGAVPMDGFKAEGMSAVRLPSVKEILAVGLGISEHRPHVMAMLDEDLVIYEVLPAPSRAADRLCVLFRKLEHGVITRCKKSAARRRKEAAAKVAADAGGDPLSGPVFSRSLLRPFSNVNGYSGVFIGGYYPHWAMMTGKGVLRLHPMGIDGLVTSFSPFHNVNCSRGFLYFNNMSDLRVSVLPSHLSYDSQWPTRKVPLRATPFSVTYHAESKTYVVVSSQLVHSKRMAKIINDERGFEDVDKGDRFVYPAIDNFSVQLFSPATWEPIPGTKIEMEACEHISCCKIVRLRSEGTRSGFQGYLAVGTNYCYNEEITSRGRMLLCDIIEVVPEPGQPLTKTKLKVLYDKEQKGPVTALNHCEGYLISAIGQKLYIWQLKDSDLVGVSFVDTLVYVHSIVTIKNLVLAADIQKSIMLLRFQPEHRVLSLAAKDPKALEAYGVEFFVDNSQLGFLVGDRDKNLILYSYNPMAPESQGGTVLLRKGEFNVGANVNTFARVRCKMTDPSTSKRAVGALEKRHVTYFATLDGGLGYILPLSERAFRRLNALQNLLLTSIPHTAGLNPKLCRAPVAATKQLTNTSHSVVDGDLCWKFLSLSLSDQAAVSKRMGTSPSQLIDDLLEVDRVAAHF